MAKIHKRTLTLSGPPNVLKFYFDSYYLVRQYFNYFVSKELSTDLYQGPSQPASFQATVCLCCTFFFTLNVLSGKCLYQMNFVCSMSQMFTVMCQYCICLTTGLILTSVTKSVKVRKMSVKFAAVGRILKVMEMGITVQLIK